MHHPATTYCEELEKMPSQVTSYLGQDNHKHTE